MKPELVFALEHANWPALVLDEHGRILRTNEAAARLFGAVLDGAGALLAAIWSPENGMPVEQFIAHWLRSPTALNRLKLVVRGGATRSLFAYLCATTVLGEKFLLLQIPPENEGFPQEPRAPSGGDTTVVHKQKLDCALQLARTVALDFNNALTSILGHTSYLLSQLGPENPWRSSLMEIEKSAAKAAEIASDLATFSRQEPESQVQAAGNLNRVVQTAMDIFQSGFPGSQTQAITWESRLERNLQAVQFNEARLQQAIVRVLENAVEAVSVGGRITVSTRNLEAVAPLQDRNVLLPPGQYVCVEIADSGEGIPPQVLPRIFEPFFSTKGGTHRGLGLTWVYGIVTNHRGAVSVNSQPQQGTLVRLYLPAEARVVRDSSASAGDLRGHQTVLMVDDEDLLLTMGETILTSYGYKVFTANSGPRALEIMEQQPAIELVITDMVMPQMGGRELVERIRLVAPQTRILCTSGYVRPASQQEETGYLQKPFSCQDLLVRVKQILSDDAT